MMRTNFIKTYQKQLVLSGLLYLAGIVLAGANSTQAQSQPSVKIPIPLSRPIIQQTTEISTADESAFNLVIPTPRPVVPNILASSFARIENPTIIADALKTGLDSLNNSDIKQAIAIRDGLAKGALDRQILSWAIATSGQYDVPYAEIINAANELPGWPQIPT